MNRTQRSSHASLIPHLWSLRRAMQIAGLLVTLGIAMPAQTPPPSTAPDPLSQLVDVLFANGAISQQQYDAMKQRLGTAPVAPTAPAHELVEAETPSAQTATPSAKPNPKIITMMDKGVGLHVGPVDVTISGEINGFYDHDRVDKQTAEPIAGGLASTGTTDSSSVRNGLLPGNFSISLATHQMGYDVGVTFGFYPGLNSVSGVGGANSAGNAAALGTTGIDFRQQFATVGKPTMGTFKVGRDIGLFGQEAILNDFSLLGVGTTGGNIAPSNTSLGRIGIGYVYTDFIPQITYTTPSASGFQAAFGVFTPLDAVNFSGLSGVLTAHDAPQFQGKLTYALPGTHPAKLKLWTNVVTQSLQSNAPDEALATGTGTQGTGVDYGGLLSVGGASLVAYGYDGWGLGTTGLFFDAVSPTGLKRDSYGYYIQPTYTFNGKFTLGASYGLSHLSLASGEVNPTLMSDNASEIAGARYKLTDWVNLVGEYTHTRSTSHAGIADTSDSVAVGSILFF
jgi:predicted porin